MNRLIRHVMLASVALALLAPTTFAAADPGPVLAADATCIETGARPPYDQVCVDDPALDACDGGTRPGQVCFENGQLCVTTGARPPFHVVCVDLRAEADARCFGGDGIDRPRVCLENGQLCVYKYVGEVPWWYCVDLRAQAAASAGDAASGCIVGDGGDGINVCREEDGDVCTYGSIGHPPYGPYCVPVSRLGDLVWIPEGCIVGDGGDGLNVCREPDGRVCTYGSIGHPPYGPYCVGGPIQAAASHGPLAYLA